MSRRGRERKKLGGDANLSLCVGYVNLAIPLPMEFEILILLHPNLSCNDIVLSSEEPLLMLLVLPHSP